MEVLVLGARAYNFVDDNGQAIKGIKVSYVDLEEKEEEAAARGYTPATVNADIDQWEALSDLPALVELKTGTKVSKAGAKPTLYIKRISATQPVDLEQIMLDLYGAK